MSVSGLCFVPRHLSLNENVHAKEGRKETTGETVPFPWSLVVHHQSLVSTLGKTKHLRRRLLWPATVSIKVVLQCLLMSHVDIKN